MQLAGVELNIYEVFYKSIRVPALTASTMTDKEDSVIF